MSHSGHFNTSGMLKAHYVLRGSRKLRFSAHVIQSEKLIGALIDGLAALRWLQGGPLSPLRGGYERRVPEVSKTQEESAGVRLTVSRR
jgi:hypothetical protein